MKSGFSLDLKLRGKWLPIWPALLVLLSAVLAACGGGSGSSEPSNPAPARVELSIDSLLFTAKDQTQQVTVRAFDDSGAAISVGKPTFTSSRPNEISVDAAGIVRVEVSVGSSIVTATVNGVTSQPLVLASVELASGVITVRDSQIVGEPVQDFNTPPGVGRRQTVTLTGTAPIDVGSILLGMNSKALAGRVVSTSVSSGRTSAVVELVPLNEIFRNANINATLTPAQVAAISSSQQAAASSAPGGQRPEKALAAGATGSPKCTPSASLEVLSIDITRKLTTSSSVVMNFGATDGVTRQFRLLYEGTAQLDFESSTTIGSGSGQIDCRLRVAPPLDMGNVIPVLKIYGPAVAIDLDVRLEGNLSSNGTLTYSGSTGQFNLRAGFAYDTANGFANLSGIDPFSPSLTTSPNLSLVSPSARAELGASAGIAADLVLTSPLMSWVPLLDPTTLELPLIDSFAGFGFDSSWGTPSDAINDPTFKPAYDFAAKGQIGVDSDLMSRTVELLGVAYPVGVNLSSEWRAVLAHSPDALRVSASRANFSQGDTVNFIVELDPATASVFGVYNVAEIRLYERVAGDTAVKVASSVVNNGQWNFSIPWVATHAGTLTSSGQSNFHAFIVPRLFSSIADVLPLELGPAVDAPVVLTAPSIVTPLRDATAVAGGTATFTVQAGGDGPLSYQWLRGGVAIPGAPNLPSYTTPALTTADNGAAYAVNVSNAAGSAISGPVTLTVSAVAQSSPDLTVQNIVFGSTVAAGSPIQITFTIANSGSATAAASTAVVRINQSSTSSAGTNLASISIPQLGVGSSVNTGASVSAPQTPGDYRIWVIADNTNSAGQSTAATANDIVLAAGTLTITPVSTTMPDLVVSSFTFSPTSVVAGGNIQALLAVRNQGSGSAATSTAVIRINQSTTSAAGTNLASISVPALAAGASAGLPGVVVPAPTTAGNYRVWVVLDNTRTAGQSVAAEGNDIVLASGVLTVSPQGSPDLAANSLAFSPTNVAPGGSVQVQLGVINQGSAPAAASSAAIRINQSTAGPTGTNVGSISVPALSAGSSAGLPGVLVQAPTAPGVYQVWVVLDADNTAGQSGAALGNDVVMASATLTVAAVNTGPVVNAVTVSPSNPAVGTPVVFDVAGSNLQIGYSLSFPGCVASEVNPGTTSLRRFVCTLSQAGAGLTGTVSTSAGSVVFTFSQTVTTNPAGPAPGGLYVGYYAEDALTNPEDPTVGALYFSVPASNGPFSGAMYFTVAACQSNNVGAISGVKSDTGITGTWSGTIDAVPQSGNYDGAYGTGLGSFSGTYTVAGGKQFITVTNCLQYYVAPKGTWEATRVGGGVPSNFVLSVNGSAVTWTNPVGSVLTLVSVIDAAEASSGSATAVKYQATYVGVTSFDLASVIGLTLGRSYIVSVATSTAKGQRTGVTSAQVTR